jgi:hypothetical protein
VEWEGVWLGRKAVWRGEGGRVRKRTGGVGVGMVRKEGNAEGKGVGLGRKDM